MTDVQFVKQLFPNAYLDFVSVPGIPCSTSYYQIRESRPFGKIIAKGSTRSIAWNNAKANVKKILYENIAVVGRV